MTMNRQVHLAVLQFLLLLYTPPFAGTAPATVVITTGGGRRRPRVRGARTRARRTRQGDALSRCKEKSVMLHTLLPGMS